jgi:two-component system, cell cycle response regulator
MPTPAPARSTYLLALALATSAGLLLLVAIVAVATGTAGLAAVGAAGAAISIIAGADAWRTAKRQEASLTAVTQALLGLADGDFDVDLPADPGTAALVQAFRRMSASVRGSVEDLARSRREFRRAVARLGDTLAATHDRNKILEAVSETAQLAVQGDQGVFYELSPARKLLVARSGLTADGGEITVRLGEGLAGSAAVSRSPCLYPGDIAPQLPEPACETAMAVPFFSRGDLLGVVAVYGRPAAPFGSDDLESLETLAAQAGTAVDNVSLHEEAQRLSITDGLTGLWNRRQLELRCQEELERAIRFGRPVGVVFCDVDRFKAINDDPEWGHPGGDSVLVEVAQRLASATREIDVVARYGGEEFVLLLPETDLAGTYVLAEKVRRLVMERPIEHAGKSRTVTLSFGVAAYPHSGANVRSLLDAADAALLRAKRAGRNRIEQAEPKIRGTGTGG